MDAIHVTEPLPVAVLRELTGLAAMALLEAYSGKTNSYGMSEQASAKLQQDIQVLGQSMAWLKGARKEYELAATDELTDEYHTFCENVGLKLGSADEHFNDPRLSPQQQSWLRDFAKRWDAVFYPGERRMKYREVLALNTNKPKVHSVYRIIDTECWLVKGKHARVGEEYTLTVGSDGNIVALGPLIPGTITLADAGGQFRPGNLDRWAFVEYRVRHGGEMVGVHTERKRVFPVVSKGKAKGVKK